MDNLSFSNIIFLILILYFLYNILTNIKKIENFNGVIPVKFKKTTRYGSHYDKNSYYNCLLNDYYNGTTNQKEELFKSLEK